MMILRSTPSVRAPVRAGRRGYTLVEVLVVVGVVAILISIMLPALFGTRETGRRTVCINALRQVGLAAISHNTARGLLPHNGGWDGAQTFKNSAGEAFNPATTDFGVNRTFNWGVGDPTQTAELQGGSWLYSILPYIDEKGVYDAQAQDAVIPFYVCPSRRPARAETTPSTDEFGEYHDGGLTWSKTDYAGNAQVIPGRGGKRPKRGKSLAEIRDGLSMTILAGEKAINPTTLAAQSWHWDEPYFLGGSSGTVRSGGLVLLDAVGSTYRNNWGAAHPDTAQFVFCDGSVQSLGYEIDTFEFSKLVTLDALDVPVQ